MPKTEVTLTDADRAILREIQRDGRMTNQALAEATAMSASACWRRVQALEESGVITGYAARVDPICAGLGFSALIEVTLSRSEPGGVEGFLAAVAERDEILQCFAVTGGADFLLRVVAADMGAFNRFLDEVLYALPAVQRIDTTVVLDVVKDSEVLPL